jgi:uncharacterized protein (TIGR02996 family)
MPAPPRFAMSDDQGFINALLAKPKDDTIRLVYADWLDERGDVRGAFLRLLVEAARDDGVRVRRQVNESRRAFDPEWVAAVIRPNHLGFEWTKDRSDPNGVLLIDRDRFGPILRGKDSLGWLCRRIDSIFVEVPEGRTARRQIVYDLWAEVRVGKQSVTWGNFGGPIAYADEERRHRTGPFVFRREDYTRALKIAYEKCRALAWKLYGSRR